MKAAPKNDIPWRLSDVRSSTKHLGGFDIPTCKSSLALHSSWLDLKRIFQIISARNNISHHAMY
jgi:hypothetical protein